MALYKNKYRVESTRLMNWDYSWDGYYYITICTKNRVYYFGNVVNAHNNISNDTPKSKQKPKPFQPQMQLSVIGQMAYKYWQEIPNHFPFVRLDEFVILPNHIHGIIIIDNDGNNGNHGINHTVETQDFASLQSSKKSFAKLSKPKTKFGPQSRNIASIIRGYKIGVTKYSKKNGIIFKWQARFYDHIIRNAEDLNRIREYIKNNIYNWSNDDLYDMEKNK